MIIQKSMISPNNPQGPTQIKNKEGGAFYTPSPKRIL